MSILYKYNDKQIYCTIYIYSFRGVIVIVRRKWTRRHEFKCWTRLIAFHLALIPLGKCMNPFILPPAMGK